ncbi:MAG: ABC transporter permease subunit, partial [Chitinophagales bacterium]|nr:ABC transporter permease subunit [Chitinophagales bacterium]
QFFGSLVGYVAIAIFLVLSALFTFVFPTTSVLESGFATLDTFFSNAPLFFLFLIPAITMRLFSEEYSTGTIELLVTKPISQLSIIFGKYLAALCITLLSLLPTLWYYFSISKIAAPAGNIDTGGIMGSYIGLMLLGAGFVAIGTFSSALSNNQIIAFLIGILLCFLFYMGFDFIAKLPVFMGTSDYFVERLGINSHYLSLSRGVIDTRDVVYFLSLIAVFLLLTQTLVGKKK